MGIFSRMRDIINSNLSAMLDRAEDPEKLVKLMITEMEDTLVEIKASCAGAIANKKRVQRYLDEAKAQATGWEQKAQLAVDKGREDLAREALREKRSFEERVTALEAEVEEFDALVTEYRSDIGKLEEKLTSAREKQRILVQRHIHADRKRRSETDIRHYDNSDAVIRFEQFENRIERLEAEADLVNSERRKPTLEDEIDSLKGDDKIEEELEKLKASVKKGADGES